jgi:hypothetical protein
MAAELAFPELRSQQLTDLTPFHPEYEVPLS